MKLDGFDMLVVAAVAVLMAAAAAYSLSGGERRATGAAVARSRAASPSPDIYPKLSAAKALLDAGQVKESVDTLAALEKEYPADPEAHALLGQAYAKLEDYPHCMSEFKAALAMDPDYVDKKSEKFIGKRIKTAVRDGMAEAKASLAKNPADPAARAELSDAYYLEKMLAGGCE